MELDKFKKRNTWCDACNNKDLDCDPGAPFWSYISMKEIQRTLSGHLRIFSRKDVGTSLICLYMETKWTSPLMWQTTNKQMPSDSFWNWCLKTEPISLFLFSTMSAFGQQDRLNPIFGAAKQSYFSLKPSGTQFKVSNAKILGQA